MHFCNQNIASRMSFSMLFRGQSRQCQLVQKPTFEWPIVDIKEFSYLSCCCSFVLKELSWSYFGEWFQGLRDICLRGWGLGSPAVQQVLSHHIFITTLLTTTGWCTSTSTPPPSLSAISTTMLTIHDHHGDDIEIRACCSPPPGRLPSYFSAGSSSRGKSNQPTLIKCQMSHKYKTILLFLWLLS